MNPLPHLLPSLKGNKIEMKIIVALLTIKKEVYPFKYTSFKIVDSLQCALPPDIKISKGFYTSMYPILNSELIMSTTIDLDLCWKVYLKGRWDGVVNLKFSFLMHTKDIWKGT